YDDRADAAAEEGVLPRVDARVDRIADAGVMELRPVLPAVGGLVDPDARLAAGGAAVRLAGAEVERVVVVARVEHERPDRVLVEILGAQLLPDGIRCQRVLRPPDAAAGDSGPEPAPAGRAVRIRHEPRDAARGRVLRSGERGDARLDRVRARPVELPLTVVPEQMPPPSPLDGTGIGTGDLRVSRLGPLRDRQRDRVRRIRTRGLQIGLVAIRPKARLLRRALGLALLRSEGMRRSG